MAELKNIRIAISGIYDYAAEELPSLQLNISDAPEKKRVYKVYRPASVLAASVDKFKMLPLTHHHPTKPVDEQNFRKLAVGYTGENPFIDYLENKNEVGIRSTAILYDEEVLDAYYRGEVQLSPGYVAEFAWENGTSPNGENYDIVMRDIKSVNHLALLPAGRGGADAVVMDSAAKEPTIFDLVKMQIKDADWNESDHNRKSNGQFAKKGNGETHKDYVSKEENEQNKKRVFGKEYKGFTGINAIKKLMQEKQGFIQNAFSREDIGNIDVVYGKITDAEKHKGYGLAHIFDKHPEITAELITEIIENGRLEKTYNGFNLYYGDYIVGLNNGYKENEKLVTVDNWIVTSFNNKKGKVNDAIASAATFPLDTSRSRNLFSAEIVIQDNEKIKSIFEIIKERG